MVKFDAKTLKDLITIKGKFENNLLKVNLLFIFLFLNIWDLVISRELFNAMALGMVLFAPAVLFWSIGGIRGIVLVTLFSIFEFMVILVFVLEGFQLGGFDTTLKSVFWVPYLVMAGVNGYWGLRIYSEQKEGKKLNDG